jgi:predicted lipoprotein with Yx(FWY)xxD motif
VSKPIYTALVAAAAALLLAACGGSSYSSGSGSPSSSSSAASAPSSSVKLGKSQNAKLGETVLVDAAGKTLYSLSAEAKGRFICTSSGCLALWHPLLAGGGATPAGVPSLGTVRRPDGKLQVTYNARPLYTFASDTRAGQASGQGFKDVGTWSAVAVSGASQASPQPQPGGEGAPSYSGGGYR